MTEKTKTTKNSLALVLNQGLIPIDVIPWEESILVKWGNGRGVVLAEYPDMFVRTGYSAITGEQGVFKVPSVIQYLDAPVDKVQYVRTLQPTRENLLKREKYKCCYCHCRLTLDTATIEHVYPQSKGGLDDWINCRMACSPCNRKKGDRLLSELGWKLDEVAIPTVTSAVSKSIMNKVGGRILDESWRPYINWEVVWK